MISNELDETYLPGFLDTNQDFSIINDEFIEKFSKN